MKSASSPRLKSSAKPKQSESRSRKQAAVVKHPKSAAYRAGKSFGRDNPLPQDCPLSKHLQQLWVSFWFSKRGRQLRHAKYADVSAGFMQGVCGSLGIPAPPLLLLPTRKTVAAVVTAMNEEERTVPVILTQLERLPLEETILILSGSPEQAVEAPTERAGTVVVRYDKPLGHDVGRAIGAKLSTADIVLFLDAGPVTQAEKLADFVQAVDGGIDLALADTSSSGQLFYRRDGIAVVKEFLNRSLGRADLGTNSLTSTPHAISRKAIDTLSHQAFMVPPKALALAIVRGLRVEAPVSIRAAAAVKPQASVSSALSPLEQLFLGDHVEAFRAAMETAGGRLSFADSLRRRMGSEQ